MLFSGSAGTWTEVCSEFPGSVVKWFSEGLDGCCASVPHTVFVEVPDTDLRCPVERTDIIVQCWAGLMAAS